VSAPFAEQGLDFVHLFGKLGIKGSTHVVTLLIQLLLELAYGGFHSML